MACNYRMRKLKDRSLAAAMKWQVCGRGFMPGGQSDDAGILLQAFPRCRTALAGQGAIELTHVVAGGVACRITEPPRRYGDRP